MVGGVDVDLSSVLQTLASKRSSLDDKIEAYTNLCSHFKEDELSFVHLDVTKHADRVLTQLKKDILHDSQVISQNALQILGYCLHDQETVRFISAADTGHLLKTLCGVIDKTDDKTTCTRALWCISKQALSADVVAKQVPALLSSCEQALSKWKGQSPTVEHEIACVVGRLLDQVPKQMGDSSLVWVKLLLPLSVHPAVKIREKVIGLFEDNLSVLTTSKGLAHSIAGEFKSKISPEMKNLFTSKSELLMLRLWKVVVVWFGEELHRGTSLINPLLSIAELGFKHAATEVKVASFEAWRTLIDNFATNPSVLGDVKRIKLVMQVLKLNNNKKEQVAKTQFDTWWHFIKLLGPKSSAYFEQVIAPLFSFCLGGTKLAAHTLPSGPGTPLTGLKSGISSPLTPRLNLSSSGSTSSTFSALQKKGCEALARILTCQKVVSELPAAVFSIDELTVDVITGPAMFLKHATLLIHSATELICSTGTDIPQTLLMYIWQSLAFHLRTALTVTAKSENRDAFSTFLEQFQTIVLSQTLSHQTVLSMFKVVCSLPQTALASTAYSIKTGEHGEIVRGTPALYLCEVLLTPTLLKACAGLESYMSRYSQLVNCGVSNASGVLEFCQAVTELIDRNAEFIPNVEAMWRLWSVVANTLHEHILKTNEVNQGDSLEYNFSCLYTVLLLPVKHRMGSKMASAVSKTMLKTWSDLYHSFARMAALVPNARANTVCEEFVHKIHNCLLDEDLKDASLLDFLAQICEVIINSVDFSSFGSPFNFNSGVLASPSKWLRKRKPMENLHSFVILLSKMVDALVQLSSSTDGVNTPRQKGGSTLTAAASEITDVLMTLFTHVNTSSIISNMLSQLSSPLGQLFHASTTRTNHKLYSPAFMQKLEKLWLDICTCIQSRYSMPYDSDFLSHISPLLEANFLHPRRQIKNQTVLLWNATFSHSALLTYPDELKTVLTKVKEKTSITLPGFVSSDVVIEETPLSQFGQGDSQAPEPHIPGLPSPSKIVGSFLHKAVSPSIKKSPAKPVIVSPKAISSVKKKLKIDDFREGDFVVISTTPKRKRVLTDHQKEVLKEKKILPTMYSSLDASMDVSLMSQFAGSDTQQDSQSQTLLTNSVISINSTQSQSEGDDKKGKEEQKQISLSFPDSFDLPGNKTKETDSLVCVEAPVHNTRRRSRKSVTFGTEHDTNDTTKSDAVEASKDGTAKQSKTPTEKNDGKDKNTKTKVSRRKSVVTVQESEESDSGQESSSVDSKKSKDKLSDGVNKESNKTRSKTTGELNQESSEESNKSRGSSSDGVDKESPSLESNKSKKKSSDSSDEVSASDSLKPNLLQAMGCSIFDVMSGKSTSSSSPDEIHTEAAPSGGEQSSNVVDDGCSSQSGKKNSGKGKNQESKKSLRSSVPHSEAEKLTPERKTNTKKISHKQLSPVRISFSQEEFGSSISPSKRMESPGRKSLSQEALSSIKSPGRKTRSKLRSLPAGNSCLDTWLVKSPAKASTASKDSSKSQASESSSNRSSWLSSSFRSMDDSSHGQPQSEMSHTLVEDTQSPTKFTDASEKVEEIPHVLVEETPVKETNCGSPDPLGLNSTSRNLFGSENVFSTSPSTELGSPRATGKEEHKSIALKSPVLCITKLSPEKVEQLCHSGSSVTASADVNSEESVDKEENTDIQCSQGFFASVNRPEAHSIVSDIINDTITFAQQVIRTDSQTSTNSVRGFSGILSMEQREELKETSESSSLDGPQSSVIEKVQKSDQLSAGTMEDNCHTEEMFSQDTERKGSRDSGNRLSEDSYDPQLVSTLKSSSGSSSQGDSERSLSSSESSSQKSSQEVQLGSTTYDPTAMGTFVDDKTNNEEAKDKQLDSDNVEMKERVTDRKRKQNFPKKVSPSKLRRTPRSRRKSKCRHGGSCCDEDGNNTEKKESGTDSQECILNMNSPKTDNKKSSSRKSARSSLKFDVLDEKKTTDDHTSEKPSPVCNENVESDIASSLESSMDPNLDLFVVDALYCTAETETPDKGKKSLMAILGEETPESRPPSVTPVRRSTTKHKMEEAKRRSSREGTGKGMVLSEGLDFETMLSQSELPKKKPRKSLCMKKNLDVACDESPISFCDKEICDDQKISNNSSLPLTARKESTVEGESTLDKGTKTTSDMDHITVVSSDPKLKQQFESLMSSESSELSVIPPTAEDSMKSQLELLNSPKAVTSLKTKKKTKLLSSPLSLRLRSSRLVLRARQKVRVSSRSPRLDTLKRKTITKIRAKTTGVKDKDVSARKSQDNAEVISQIEQDTDLSVECECEPVSDSAPECGVASVEVKDSEAMDAEGTKFTSDMAVTSAEDEKILIPEAAVNSEQSEVACVTDLVVSDAVTSEPKTACILDPHTSETSAVSKDTHTVDLTLDDDDSIKPTESDGRVTDLASDRPKNGSVTELVTSVVTNVVTSAEPGDGHKQDLELDSIIAPVESNIFVSVVIPENTASASASMAENTASASVVMAENTKSVVDSLATGDVDTVLTSSDCDKTTSTLTGESESLLPPLDETPKKYKIRKKVIFPHRVVSSDSKLHMFAKSRSKYSDRGMSIVRRSILKNQVSDHTNLSPLKRSHDLSFRPIRVHKINSPSASPSAGILKRRFLHHSLPVDAPSPPEKERRVSFAEPVVSGESPKSFKYWKVSREPVRSTSASSTVTGSSSEVDPNSPFHRNPEPSQSGSSAGSELTQSGGSYKSTQESQLDSKDPVYPDLIGCTESVAKVLPQLTSSMWSRGLVQLVKARNINTVGDLCSLSELEIHNLPIRSPKVITVRRALQEMEQQITGKKTRAGAEEGSEKMASKSLVAGERVALENKENLNKLDSIIEAVDEPDLLPSADDALLELDQKDCEDLNSSIEDGDDATVFVDNSCLPVCENETCEMSCDQINQSVPEIKNNKTTVQPTVSSPSKMDSTPIKILPSTSTMDITPSKMDSTPSKTDSASKISTSLMKMDSTTSKMDSSTSTSDGCQTGSMVSVLEDLVQRYTTKDIERFRTNDLFTVHHHLASLSNMVVTAMKKRCSSPPSSQE
ncbi:telomere-associated protein RIF1-like [Gigantopelta aegis]|uniref:telomere-associated protein RIF1-like n=1 Tax=Gigantopelta aegis TaxID=1735272 RepID=UPI001B8884B9|nr:telomere-associated protein RIF1-like [Gigantopelta aegis]